MTFGRYLEEFQVGQHIIHPRSKTVLESDNNLFCLLTMNHHPVHLDVEYAASTQHKQVLVVGTLVFSLVVGLTVPEISGLAIANLDYKDIKHHKPVFIGDTLNVTSHVLAVRESQSKPDRGIVAIHTQASNQLGDVVLSFVRHILIPKERT